MGSSTSSKKPGAFTGSKNAQVGMADTHKGSNVSGGRPHGGNPCKAMSKKGSKGGY